MVDVMPTSPRTWRKNHPSVSLLGLFYWGKALKVRHTVSLYSLHLQFLSKCISLADLQVCSLYGDGVTCCSL